MSALMPGKKQFKTFDLINARVKELLKIKNDRDVASFLGITPQAFYSRKKTNSFPIEKLKTRLEKKNIYTQDIYRWLIIGSNLEASSSTDEAFLIYQTKLKELSKENQQLVFKLIKKLHDHELLLKSISSEGTFYG